MSLLLYIILTPIHILLFILFCVSDLTMFAIYLLL